MNWQGLEKESSLFFRGLIAAVAASAITAIMSYVGAHLPTIVNGAVIWLGGYAGTKTGS